MNNYKKQRFPVKRIFILDEIALLLSLFSAFIIRYGENAVRWHDMFEGLYVSVVVFVCIFQVIVFLLYDCRREHIFVQDPVENFMSVLKGKCMIVAFLLLYLYAIQRGKESSRLVIGMFFGFSILYSFVFRIIYRKKNRDRFLSMLLSPPV